MVDTGLRTYAQANINLPAQPGCDNPEDCPATSVEQRSSAKKPSVLVRGGLATLAGNHAYRLQIVDAQGRTVRAMTVQGPAQVKLDKLRSGICWLRAKADGNHVSGGMPMAW
jgi:hypothetical protein